MRKVAKVKVQITMDEDLLHRLDTWADDNYLTRSGLITNAVAQYLNQNEAVQAVKGIAFSLRKIADSGSVTDDQMKELEDWGRAIEIIAGKGV